MLYHNELKLAERGIYYAHRARARALNQLASLIATGRKAEAQALIDSHLAKASAAGATTLLISAESFFAMTMFFHKLEGETCEHYWAAESRCIELLHGVLPADMPKRVVVFFRRQDKFLESVYAQTVRTRPLSESCEQFRDTAGEALDYARHMRLWRRAFPDCAVTLPGSSCAMCSRPATPSNSKVWTYGSTRRWRAISSSISVS
jgi:hypothetical protein